MKHYYKLEMTWIYVLKVNDNDIERMLVGKIPSKCEKKDKLKILKKLITILKYLFL